MTTRATLRALLPPLALLLTGALASGCFSTAEPRIRLAPEQAQQVETFPFEDFDAVVSAMVDEGGMVDYPALRADPEALDRYLAHVADAGPSAREELFPTETHRLAFFINAYNATVLRNVINREPMQRIDSALENFFFFTRFRIDGREISLKSLEDDVIRAGFHEPRVHFALNCASESCPRLPNEAFTPERLEEQLDREAREFVADSRSVDVAGDGSSVRLSQIFEWYGADFVEYERSHDNAGGTVIDYINRYRAEDAQIPADASIEYIPYDWSINSQREVDGARSS